MVRMTLGRKKLIFILTTIIVILVIYRFFFYFDESSQDKHIYRTAGAPLVISVYYEALCPDSKHFILKQLLPAVERFGDLVEVDLVPFGKATTVRRPDGSYKFNCQHGSLECEANIFHACSIATIPDVNVRLNVIGCMIRDNRNPKEALMRCTKEHNVKNVSHIEQCSESSHGSELLKLHGDSTMALRPAVSFIPTITLDGNQGNQASILKDLQLEVCKKIHPDDNNQTKC